MKKRGSEKLADLPTVTQGVRAEPGFESRAVWVQNPRSFYTGFWTLSLGPSQVSTNFPGISGFPCPVAMVNVSVLLWGHRSACASSVLGTCLGQRVCTEGSLLVERAPLSAQSSKSLVIANLTEVWAGFLLLKQSRGPSVEMTGLWVLYEGL